MKYNSFLRYLHKLFSISIILSVFFTTTQNSIYNIIILSIILILWIVHGCFLKDYEAYVAYKYDKNKKFRDKCCRTTYCTNFHDFSKWWLVLIVLLLISIARYYYKYDIFTYPYNTNLFIHIFFIICILLLSLLINISFEHYSKYKYMKQFVVYWTIFTLVSIGYYLYLSNFLL